MAKTYLHCGWKGFVRKMNEADRLISENHLSESVLNDRLEVLAFCRQAFSSGKSFAEMETKERKRIAGLISGDGKEADFKFFGSMSGAGHFSGAVSSNRIEISDALDLIPMQGKVTKEMYLAYVEKIKEGFTETGGVGIATLTRLLAMKRPDYFFCLDRENIEILADLFDQDIPFTWNISMAERYWDELILTIQKFPWWKTQQLRDAGEKELADGRVAMLDLLIYSRQQFDHSKLL